MPVILLRLAVAYSLDDIRDFAQSAARTVEIFLIPSRDRWIFISNCTDPDDGSDFLRPTWIAADKPGRWVRWQIATGGGGGGGVTLPILESDVTNLPADLAALTAADATEAAARAAADTTEATARAAGDAATLSAAETYADAGDATEAAARAAADALLVPKARNLNATAPVKIDGGASADLSADRTLSVDDATGSSKGVIELAEDLGGTAAAPEVVAIHEPGGPTQLVIAAIADGQYLQRSGGTIVGVSGVTGAVDFSTDQNILANQIFGG